MEKIAIFSDVHGNITALEAVLKDIESRGIQHMYCLGDYTIKCAHPELVIDLLKQKHVFLLKGNCDEVICRPNVPLGNFWSRDKIGEERASFIYQLPVSTEFYISGHLVRLFHASPISLEHIFNPMYENTDTNYRAVTIHNPADLFLNTDFIGKTDKDPIPDVVGYGHLHTPNLFRFQNKTLFNVGSVGIPTEMLNTNALDSTNRLSTMASYVILEGNLNDKELGPLSYSFMRIPYNIHAEVTYLENSDMPNKDLIIRSLQTAIH